MRVIALVVLALCLAVAPGCGKKKGGATCAEDCQTARTACMKGCNLEDGKCAEGCVTAFEACGKACPPAK